jgi:hypothetical protein
VDLGFLSLNAQSGYDSATKVKYHFRKHSWLCANNKIGPIEARSVQVWAKDPR